MKFSIKKYMGDDSYSWAVFRASDVKGMRSPICDPYIRPVVCGCSRMEANGYKKRFEAEAK
jgi:hypothetical protein|tara:strand:+ start:125 stop:307 length:183 start_codon:yes stop_codon:yes gene_type:complete